MQLNAAHALSLVVQMRSKQQDGVLQRGREFTAAHLHKLILAAVGRRDDRLLRNYEKMLQVLVIIREIIRADVLLEQFQTYSLCHNLRR